MANRMSHHWHESERFECAPGTGQSSKNALNLRQILLDFPLRNELKRIEGSIRMILWTEAQKRRYENPEIDDTLTEMAMISNEFEVTAAAREHETVEESVKNDPDHSMHRMKLVHSVGTIPEVRAVLEPMFDRRNAIRKHMKKLQILHENNGLN